MIIISPVPSTRSGPKSLCSVLQAEFISGVSSRLSHLATKLAVLSTIFLTSGGGYIIPTIGLAGVVSSFGSSSGCMETQENIIRAFSISSGEEMRLSLRAETVLWDR